MTNMIVYQNDGIQITEEYPKLRIGKVKFSNNKKMKELDDVLCDITEYLNARENCAIECKMFDNR